MSNKINTYLKALLILCLIITPSCFATERLVVADSRGDWGPLSPYLHKPSGPAYIYTSFVFDTLLWKNVNGILEPALAESWAVNEKNNCYTFKPRADAYWHDGEKISIDDLLFTFEYMQKHPYIFADLSPIKAVSVDTDNQLQVCLHHEFAPFLTNIAATVPILPKHIFKTIKNPKRFRTPQAFIGSGPYKLVDYNRTLGRYQFARNKNYYAYKPRYEQLKIVKMNSYAALTAMEREMVDVFAPQHQWEESFRSKGFTVKKKLSNHPFRLLFNHQNRFSEKKLRHALAYAINRQDLITIAFNGKAELASTGFLPLSFSNTLNTLNTYTYNPKTAMNLLNSIGWKKTAEGAWHKQGKPLTLELIASSQTDTLARTLTAQLAQFGIQVNLRLLQGPQLNQAIKTRAFDMALVFTSHNGDPDRFRKLITSNNLQSDNYHKNPELLRLLNLQQQTTDKSDRQKLLTSAAQHYNEDLPSYPLVNPYSFIAFDPQTVNTDFTESGIATGIPVALNKSRLFKPVSDNPDL